MYQVRLTGMFVWVLDKMCKNFGGWDVHDGEWGGSWWRLGKLSDYDVCLTSGVEREGKKEVT